MSDSNSTKPIRSFRDLDVYQNSYKAMIRVFVEMLPLIPKTEQYDLANQLRRSSKAIPRLIAEGYAKKHQRLGFQKHLDDALGESNQTMVSLEQGKDIYHIDTELVDGLVDMYDKTSRQLFKLSYSWNTFKERSKEKKTEEKAAVEQTVMSVSVPA